MLLRIMVVDDHPLSAEGVLKHLSVSDHAVEVLGVCSRKAETLAQTDILKPDSVLLNYESTGMDAPQLTKDLQNHPGLRVVVYNAPEKLEALQKLLSAGVFGYLLKNTPSMHILDAIQATVEDKTLLA